MSFRVFILGKLLGAMRTSRRCCGRNSWGPRRCSSCFMRVVTFDCTRWSRAAAFVMEPCSATVLKISRAVRSMFPISRTITSQLFISHNSRVDRDSGMGCHPEPIQTPPGSAASRTAVALVGLTALAIAMGIGRFAFTPILPMMRQDQGLSVADGGWLASANYLSDLLGACSGMVLRVRPVPVIRTGLVVIGIGTLGMGLEHGFAAWLVLRDLAGGGSASFLGFSSAWCLERLAPVRRPVLNGVVFAGVGNGIAVPGGVFLGPMHAGPRCGQGGI